MRTVFVRTSCGCSAPGLVKTIEREAFQKAAAAQLAKGRAQPAVTRVSAYVSRKEGSLSRKLAKTLRKRRGSIRDQVASAYARAFPDMAKLAKDDRGARIERILDAMRTGVVADDLVADVTPAMLDAYRRAAAAGVAEVGVQMLPEMTEQMDEAARDYAKRRGGELITDLAKTTEDDMRGLLARAIEDGMSVQQLRDEIDDMGAFGPARARVIARTELAFAHVQGNLAGWKETGLVVGKRAILGDLHDVPDICDECAEAGAVGIDDDFVDGYDFPPFHPNCVCDVEPILADEPDEET